MNENPLWFFRKLSKVNSVKRGPQFGGPFRKLLKVRKAVVWRRGLALGFADLLEKFAVVTKENFFTNR